MDVLWCNTSQLGSGARKSSDEAPYLVIWTSHWFLVINENRDIFMNEQPTRRHTSRWLDLSRNVFLMKSQDLCVLKTEAVGLGAKRGETCGERRVTWVSKKRHLELEQSCSCFGFTSCKPHRESLKRVKLGQHAHSCTYAFSLSYTQTHTHNSHRSKHNLRSSVS